MAKAWFFAGEEASLSEQQLMDCSWGHGLNKACDGGDQDEAVQYLVEAGGLASEASYPYRGQDGFCQAKNVSANDVVKFKVRVRPKSEAQRGQLFAMPRAAGLVHLCKLIVAFANRMVGDQTQKYARLPDVNVHHTSSSAISTIGHGHVQYLSDLSFRRVPLCLRHIVCHDQ